MTPVEPSWETVRAKLRALDGSLEHLAHHRGVTAERLEHDLDTGAIVERLLSRIVDLAVDINTHVAASRLERSPESYRASFDLAADAELIERELARRLRPSAGLRNAIVHAYVGLDLSVVAASVPRALTDYRDYVDQVARAMQGVRDAEPDAADGHPEPEEPPEP